MHLYPEHTIACIQLISCLLSDHCAIRLEIESKHIASNYSDSRRLNHSLLNDKWVKEKVKILLNVNENINTIGQTSEAHGKQSCGGNLKL